MEAWCGRRFSKMQGALSPDGRLAACASDKSGPFEVYVRRFLTVRPSGSCREVGAPSHVGRRDSRELFTYRPVDA